MYRSPFLILAFPSVLGSSLSLTWPVLMCSSLRFCLDDCKFRSLGPQTEARGFYTVSDPASAHLGFMSGQIRAVLRPKAFWRNSLIPIYTSVAKLFLLPTRKTGPAREDTEEMSTQVKDSAIRTHCSDSWVLSAWVGNPIRCAHDTLMYYALLALQGQQQKIFWGAFSCDWFSLVAVPS